MIPAALSPASVRLRLADVLSRAVAFLLPVTYFLVTVSFYLRTYDSAQIKITLAQIGCSLVATLWLGQLALERRWPFQKRDIPLVAPFAALLISGVLSFLQSSFREGSVDEFLRRVLYSFMGLIVITEFRGWDRHRRLFRWLLAAFGVVVFYGFVQYFDTRLFPPGPGNGMDPFLWRQAFGLRPFSTFGNPNFYGNFLVIITPIILSVYMRNGGGAPRPYLMIAAAGLAVFFLDKLTVGAFGGVDADARTWVSLGLAASGVAAALIVWWRIPPAAASAMLLFWGALFVNLYATETKGAWLGFLGALTATTALTALFLARRPGEALPKGLIGATALVVVLGTSAVGYYAYKRFQSVSFRTFTWIATWEMIRTQPVLGTGIGSFKWAYPAFRRPEIILVEAKSNTETDHAEDEYLEVWFDEGTLGFGIFLWLILTVSVAGLRALKRLTTTEPRGPPDAPVRHGEKVYSLVAYLGAWWGALAHWAVDVSVRFVSSGIYSLLLPGLVASLVRNQDMPERQDPSWRGDRWVRLGAAVFWTAVLLSLRVTFLPALLCGAGIWLLGEGLELRLSAAAPVPAGPVQRPVPAWWGYPALALLLGAWACGFLTFRGYFIGDILHNKAIFFSREGIWNKSAEFDAAAAALPPDIRRDYETTGGALEHYQKVMELNPAFPMAGYFIGNVYNDWGSRVYANALSLRSGGEAGAAEASRARAEDLWNKALATYDQIRAFAPNYVQTHHQAGLAYFKLGDMARAWGRAAEGDAHWDAALRQFDLYQKLDPVFPPNYYRKAYIHQARGDIARAESEYLGALRYNTENVVRRFYPARNAETYDQLGRLMSTVMAEKHPGPAPWPADAPEFKKAEDYFKKAIAAGDSSGDASGVPALKGLAVIYARAGRPPLAEPLWRRARELAPQDPDVRRVFGQ